MLALDAALVPQKSCFVETVLVHNRMCLRTMALADVAVDAEQTMSEEVPVSAVLDNKIEEHSLFPARLLAESPRLFGKNDNPSTRGQ